MDEGEVSAIEYALTRALKNFDAVISEEEHTLIRLSLRQGRSLCKGTDSGGKIDSISKFADSLIGSREKVSRAWEEVNRAVIKLQEAWGTYAIKQLDSITAARMKYENFLGRASGLSDIIEGVLQEIESHESAQKLIERLSAVRETEQKARKI